MGIGVGIVLLVVGLVRVTESVNASGGDRPERRDRHGRLDLRGGGRAVPGAERW